MRLWRRRHESEFSHEHSLCRLRDLGFSPRTVYDVGAYRGDWSRIAASTFPAADYVLFEANAANESELKATGRKYFIVALAADDGLTRPFFLPRHAVATGASLYRENTEHYAGTSLTTAQVVTQRLDTIVATHHLNLPDLIKLDVQGAELDVLAGAPAVIAHCRALIAELSLVAYNDGAPLMAEAIAAIDRLGLRCIDVCEVHRGDGGVAWQIDLLFVKDDLFEVFHARSGLRKH